ncbi:uncharacterized protein LOC134861160 [Eleginops maclovinus]|uniref:uncharacterized protein LOC134861160 n=1 Tax=Eleginops maclovinus TaxID=56733 RepID=UPI0030806F81
MASPFKIPKKKHLSGSDSAPLYKSPLSRLQCPAPHLKGYGDQSRGRADLGNSSTPTQRDPLFRDSVKTLLGLNSGANHRGAAAANHRGGGSSQSQPASSLLSNGRWRPKRASDRLLSPPQKNNCELLGSLSESISVEAADSLAELRGVGHAGSWSSLRLSEEDAFQSDTGSSPEPSNQQQKKRSSSPSSGDDLLPPPRSTPPPMSSRQTPHKRPRLDLGAWLTRNTVADLRGRQKNTEPIVLSSEEEEEEEEEQQQQQQQQQQQEQQEQQEQQQEQQEQQQQRGHYRSLRLVSEFGASPLSFLQLRFSSLHAGLTTAQANGELMVTEHGISIPLKGESEEGSEQVEVSVVASQLRGYGLWDGGLAQGGSLLAERMGPAPSLLFLWVTDAQASLLERELSIITTSSGTKTSWVNHMVPNKGSSRAAFRYRGSEKGTDCMSHDSCTIRTFTKTPLNRLWTDVCRLQIKPPIRKWRMKFDVVLDVSDMFALHTLHTANRPVCCFVLLVLEDQLQELQATLLASILDMKEYQRNCSSSPLEWTNGLLLLHSAPPPLDRHLLGLLGHSGKNHLKNSNLTPPGLLLPTRLIQYPPPPSKGRISVTKEDLACLRDAEFLNDVIIDFYLKYLLLEGGGSACDRSHVFSSFFYKQLSRRRVAGEEDAFIIDRDTRHQRVKTWTRHVDIFSKDFLFVPVNQEAHWFLVVVCFPGLEKPQHQEFTCPAAAGKPSSVSLGPQSETPECTEQRWRRDTVLKQPCILVMDSLKLSHHETVCRLIRDYLQVEWGVRRGTARVFSGESIRSSSCRVPQQNNCSDCGLYLLQYTESFLQNPVVNFDLPLRLENWFPRQRVRQKREEIRGLILDLHRAQKYT